MYYDSHFAFMNTTYMLLSTALPLLFQLTSLLFGAKNLKADPDELSKSATTVMTSLNSEQYTEMMLRDNLARSIKRPRCYSRKNIFEPQIEDYDFQDHELRASHASHRFMRP